VFLRFQIAPKSKFSRALPQTPLGELTALTQTVGVYSAHPDPLTDGEGARCPCEEPHPALGPSGLVSTGLRV